MLRNHSNELLKSDVCERRGTRVWIWQGGDAADLVALRLVRLVRGRRLVVVLQPVGWPAMHDLLPEPHQTDEGTQGARDHKAALQAVSQQVLPGGGRRAGGRVRGGWRMEGERESRGRRLMEQLFQ